MARNVASAALVLMAAAFVAAQFVAVTRTNPSAQGSLVAPSQIQDILKHACYDCHSNETRWPWYSRVAPVSWLIVRDVNLGRKEINFSEWGSYYPVTRRRKLEWMGRVLQEEKMAPWSYRLMHPGARLTEANRDALQRWIGSELTAPSAPTSNK